MGEEKSRKILLIEDDKFLSRMMSRTLESDGYDVDLASSGNEGLKKAEEEESDLILLDIMLPDIDGFEILKKIKNNKKTKKIPVIIMSNLGQPEDITQGEELGAADYIVKSDLSLDEISEKIAKVFAG